MNAEEKDKLSEEWTVPPEAPPRVSTWLLLGLAAGTMMVFAFAVLATWVVMDAQQRHLEPAGPSVPARLGKAQINLIRQAPMTLDVRAQQKYDADQARLSSYGWASDGGEEIHIPITEAMRRVIATQGAADGGVPWKP